MFEIIFEKYGNAILVVITLLALGGIIVAALASDGYIATAFQNAIEDFFDNMNGLLPGSGASGT